MLNKIKTNSFMGWAAIFTVIFLAPNTYYVYHSFSVFPSPYREFASIGVSLIIAASILIYTLRKNFIVAKYYSIFEVCISAYYYIDTIGWDWGLIPAFGFTLILPISVYYYSKEFAESEANGNPDGDIGSGSLIDELSKAHAVLEAKYDQAEQQVTDQIEIIDQLRSVQIMQDAMLKQAEQTIRELQKSEEHLAMNWSQHIDAMPGVVRNRMALSHIK
jgi:hypothetical protein